MTEKELQTCLEDGQANAGAVSLQIDRFLREAKVFSGNIEGSETYTPGSIL
jgi:hypothetical protein